MLMARNNCSYLYKWWHYEIQKIDGILIDSTSVNKIHNYFGYLIYRHKLHHICYYCINSNIIMIMTLCALLKQFKDVLISPGHYLANFTQRLGLQWFTWIWHYINFINTYLHTLPSILWRRKKISSFDLRINHVTLHLIVSSIITSTCYEW